MQKINFYIQPPAPEAFIYTLKGLLALCGVIILLVIIAQVDGIYKTYTYEDRIAELNRELNILIAEESKISQMLPGESEQESINEILARAEMNLLYKKSVQEAIKKGELGNVKGFSKKLENLSDVWVSGIWLENVGFIDEGDRMFFKGKARSANVVSKLLLSMQNKNEFTEINIDALNIQKENDTEYYVFSIGAAQ